VLKPIADFNFKNRATGRLHPFCRQCQHAWNRAHYARNKATYIANAHRNSARDFGDNLDRLIDYLAEHACVDCGERDILVLEFDHRERTLKPLAVANMLRNHSWAEIAREVAKCDVRCANCHRRRTAQQLGWRKMALKHSRAGAAGLEPAAWRFGDARSTN
jgi:hypothetical protein